ncbi:MAG: minor capsid protein [Gemmatimonadaceae bacterium]|nr:minor capsid protein [Gemmatimonadaceae bacterium]
MTSRERQANAQRARQARAALAVENDLVHAYRQAWQRIREDLLRAVAEIRAAEARGESIEAIKLIQLHRLTTLESQVEAEIRYAVNLNAATITNAQADAVLAARISAEDLIRTTLGAGPATWQPAFPVGAFRSLVGYSADGQPLGLLLQELGPAAGASVRKSLVTGLARGLNPNVVAREARTALGGNMVRATTIARTEILRAYRTTALETYKANEDVVTGWQWIANLGGACQMCIAMHGEIADSEDGFDTHPACKCTPIPVTKTWKELGFEGVEDTAPEIESGSDWFARQDAAKQLSVLGPGKYAAYRDGRVGLKDLVQRTQSDRWGGGRRARSLKDALAVA